MESESPATSPPETPEPAPEAAATANGAGPQTPEQVEESKAMRRNAGDMFRYSSYVHVGPGAEDCEDGEDGSCGNPLHFHSWVRLPNKFQFNSITEKAHAARARAARQLRDPEADKHAILENDMEAMLRSQDKDTIVEELLGKTFFRDQLQARREVAEDEEFATAEDDQDRWRVLNDMPEDERDDDEFNELTKHLDEWGEKVEAAFEEIQKPQREALNGKTIEELVDLVREQRIRTVSDEAFMRSYNLWMWFICTLKPRDPAKGQPTERVFGSIDHMQQAAPEVIEALDSVFTGLEGELAASAQTTARAEGNS